MYKVHFLHMSYKQQEIVIDVPKGTMLIDRDWDQIKNISSSSHPVLYRSSYSRRSSYGPEVVIDVMKRIDKIRGGEDHTFVVNMRIVLRIGENGAWSDYGFVLSVMSVPYLMPLVQGHPDNMFRDIDFNACADFQEMRNCVRLMESILL